MGTAKRERQKTNRQERLQQIEKQQARRQTKRRGLVIGGFIAAFIAVAAIIAITTGGDDEESTTDTTTTVTAATTVAGASTVAPASTIAGKTSAGETPCPPADGSSARTTTFEQAPPTCIDPSKSYSATFDTSKGAFTIALDPTAAPNGVNNFVVLARYHYYDSTICHRIIGGYMAQCGDPAGTGSGANPGYGIDEEKPADVSAYAPGTLAMANAGPGTTGGQFFVMVGQGPPPPTTDYTILGHVTDGFDTTVKAIEAAADPAADNGVPPLETVTINSVTITET